MQLSLFHYDTWANQQALVALARANPPAGPPPERALRIMAHIPAAQRIWLARIDGAPQPCPVWPEWTLGEIADALEALVPAWPRLLHQDLRRSVHYRNSKGEEFDDRVKDILQHVLAHGAYHRGQLALLLRQAGFEPAYTDYIHAVSSGYVTPE